MYLEANTSISLALSGKAHMTISRRSNFLLIGSLFVVFIAWFGWMSITQSKTELMQTKIEQALFITMQNLSPQWPRIETHSDLSAEVYYAPIINQVQTFELYRHVLEYLNQDISMPPVKITQISMRHEYGASEDTLISQASVEFPLILGIEKKMVVQSAVKIPHYKTLN
jgi:hypothetical protein